MKTRNGFVSNSSSSSFVVAFPSKPNSSKEVYKMMFNGKEGGIQPYDFIDGMSHNQIAERVWEDIKAAKVKKHDKYAATDVKVPAKLKDIKDEFENRYYYSKNCYFPGRVTDEKGGAWSYHINKYFGSDKNILDELRDLILDVEEKENSIRTKQNEIFNKGFTLKRPPFAYKGGKNNEGVAYTKKEISDYNAYEKAMFSFRKDNKEYSDLEIERRELLNKKYQEERELTEKIASADAKAFWKDYRNSFIVILSYSDNEGDSVLEHGDIFKNIPHVKISHH